jgi:DNA-binding CsgD family transcriptional regulator
VRADVVGVIEAAYSSESDDASWVRRIVEVSAPALDRGFGVFAGLYDVTEEHMRMGPAHGVGFGVQMADVFQAANSAIPPAMLDRLYKRGPCCSSGRNRAGMSKEAFRGQAAVTLAESRSGVYDAVGIVTGDPSGVGCMIMAPVRGFASVSRPMGILWTRIAAHLGAAVRMRRAGLRADAVDAVLSPSGRIEHAEPEAQGTEARAALSRGAKHIDRARGPLRRKDPDEAVATWRALVAGQWSLVDHFDHDGRRYLFARRNEPPAVKHDRLSRLEREVLALAALGHTNKLIAYQLGLAPSTVAMRLSRAASKIGARTRAQLIAACAALRAPT